MACQLISPFGSIPDDNCWVVPELETESPGTLLLVSDVAEIFAPGFEETAVPPLSGFLGGRFIGVPLWPLAIPFDEYVG